MSRDFEVNKTADQSTETQAVQTEAIQTEEMTSSPASLVKTLGPYEAAVVRANTRDSESFDFRLNHPLGKFLVRKRVLADPIEKEQKLQQRYFDDLQEKLVKTKVADTPEEAQVIIGQQPDFQPKTEEQIILDHVLDSAIESITVNAVYTNQYEDLARHDFSEDFENRFNHLRGETKFEALRAAFPEQSIEREYVFIRDSLLNVIGSGNLVAILDILKVFYKNSRWGLSTFQAATLVLKPQLSNEKFLQITTQALIKELIFIGADSFYQFAEFLEKLGISLEANKLEHAPADFISRQLETLWRRSPHRYYEVIDILLINGLTTEEILSRDNKVRVRTMQFLLYSFRQSKFRLAAREAFSIITSQLHLHDPADLTPARQRVLWMSYCETCSDLDLEIDPELKSMYRQGKINRFGQIEDDDQDDQ